jgi:hypothetical protein
MIKTVYKARMIHKSQTEYFEKEMKRAAAKLTQKEALIEEAAKFLDQVADLQD